MFLRKYKWLILILSGLTFIYLIFFNFTTINDNRDFQIYMEKLRVISENLVRKGWDDSTVAQWKISLEISKNSPKGSCNFKNIVVALHGDSLEDYLWEYVSLLVLRERWKHEHNITIGVFLSPKSKRALGKVLFRVHLDSVKTHPSDCLDFKHAEILGNQDTPKFAKDPSRPQLFLLEPGAKRYPELVHTDLIWLKGGLILRKSLLSEAKNRMRRLKESFKRENDTNNIYLVALHLGINRIPLKVPLTFYKTAINTVLKWHEEAGFVIFCPKSKMSFCKDTFDEEESHLKIVQTKDEADDLAALTLFDGNIIRSDLGFLAALLNDGETLLFQTHSTDNDPAAFVARYQPKWLLIN
ncbi:uncharacterized protein LOC129806359 [Phlebotomus papatasi]|uniref:uncharacterized protein LOC129806359 n=1 Tax=Phlebotomus papatasi TaxID=29031 RepID=UPI0024840C98|nr:uncharacterized protein LOC129806359 [Phlebotomus papatasi]